MASEQIAPATQTVTAAHVLAPSPPPEDCFETSRPIRTGDVDTEYRLRLDGIARYLQDIGTDNLVALGFDETDPLWVVRRTVIDVHRPAVWPDRIHLRRWCAAHSTRWSSMRVQLNNDENALIETEAFWINIGTETGMPARISDGLLERLALTSNEHRLRWKPWLPSMPPETDEREDRDQIFPLRVTDIDPFNHVNNAAYWHAVEESLAERPDLLEAPYRAVVEHLSPIYGRDQVRLHTRTDDSSLSLWFLVDGEVRAAARVERRETRSE
ncbi:acyl-[acyl-carrier-protein] thioesterase [Rhodococcus spongiicola]|uniref:4-hydroxybenzoyl-CoA thioesterase n=1 Tax=Rhodococcus spongiicola TaxID=2487352 RepID=A0A3S3A3X4_9NOCA|nr:acyl-ACP thioesterase domain-containing protein [Rhodococcus spongiicola]RVW01517.1 4-hydroxybenzoyl-CoA thioesterase [Rhodococcus spongiicola]